MKPQQVYLVNESGTRLLTPAEKQQLETRVLTVNEAVYVAALLMGPKQLPVEAVNLVLSFGDGITFQNEVQDVRDRWQSKSDLYLRLVIPTVQDLRLPRGVHLPQCVRVVVDCSSHDQGWMYNGTCFDSHSWSEILITTPDKPAPAADTLVPRMPLVPSMGGNNTFRCHRKVFGANEPFVQSVVPGSTVELYLRTEFPTIAIFANYGSIQTSFAMELDSNFDFNKVLLDAQLRQNWPKCVIL